jgi:hypothetical protein
MSSSLVHCVWIFAVLLLFNFAFAASVVPHFPGDQTQKIINQVWAYENAQNNKDAAATAALFTENGTANVPLGLSSVRALIVLLPAAA